MKPYLPDLRQKIVDAYDRGDISQRQLAQQFSVAKSFVQKLLKQRRETGSIAPKLRAQQTPPKLNAEHRAVLAELVKSQNDATLEELRARLHARTGIMVSVATVHNTLKRMRLSVKKTLYLDAKATDRVQQARVAFWQMVRSLLAKDLVFIDESGVNLAMMRLRARSLKGTMAHGSRANQREKNVSIIGAMSLRGVVASYSLIGATDGLTFEAFISQKLVPKLWKGACVLMDNCPVHLGKTVRELTEAVGAQLIYLPPYSSDFSPIENCWSKLKSILKMIGARTYPDLAVAIEKAFAQVSLDDIQAWFTHECIPILQ
ncbi:MAG: IS630 family transposase [Leptolyngbya sp. SIO4C1]|nr:IS630 family transposase [Leptolyngbya sp. SIO4C1]